MKQVFRVFWGCTLAAALALTGCGRGGAPGSSGAGSMSGSGSGAMSGGTAPGRSRSGAPVLAL